MDAKTPEGEELSLPEAFLLLATNDSDGKPAVPMYALRTTLAGAILAELDLFGAIEVQGKNVRATGSAPQTDFQRELELIRGKSRPHTPKRWVSMLEGRAEVQRVYEQMASRGIVERVGEKHLGLFKSMRYPEKDHGPEAALLQQIEAALGGAPPEPANADATAAAATPDTEASPVEASGAGPDSKAPDAEPSSAVPDASTSSRVPDARTAALIALLEAAGLLGKLFPAADQSRVRELANGHWPSRAVVDELRMVRLAEVEPVT